MARKKWYHKRVSNNRFLIWSMVAGFVAAIGLMSYAQLTNMSIDREITIHYKTVSHDRK